MVQETALKTHRPELEALGQITAQPGQVCLASSHYGNPRGVGLWAC